MTFNIAIRQFSPYSMLVVLLAVSPIVTGQNFTSENLNAFFGQEEPCRQTSINAVRVATNNPKGEFISIFMQVYGDVNGLSCANSPLIQEVASGGTDQAEFFVVGQRLTDASLKSTIPMRLNATGEVVPFEVAVSWQGVEGQLAVERSHEVNPGSTAQPKVSHVLGYRRPAPPYGTVSDGAANYAANPIAVDGSISVYRVHQVMPRQRLLH